ncbi:MAG: CDP-alcohol phosphatidyltransferase family protein [Deltaproteobacteria bacterium]|nr:CDP-alcohol phosphatidyltransferase family protein [Deltaproteobacteria bacterium]
MMVYVHIINESSITLWGLTPRQRILRVLKDVPAGNIVDDPGAVPDDGSVLLLRGDYLYDDRLLNYFAQTPATMLTIDGDQGPLPVAAHVDAPCARQMKDAMLDPGAAADIPGVKAETLETLSLSFQERLRKVERPFVLAITPRNRRDLERRLFAWAYKGVTDLVTKWAWPVPARWVVGQCVRFGLRPNHVTIVGLLLVVLAGVLFAYGQFGWGLLAGWLMTFLDTVDGKLARVTVTSSRFGHYFDHVIDILHPPIWYALWGVGLGTPTLAGTGIAVSQWAWAIFIFYTLGRLVEGTFQWTLGRFGIFCWRPLDSYFRLITARRNPNMIFMTLSALGGRPDLGMLAVALWTILTTLFLMIRLAQGGVAHARQGPLRSWLRDVDQPPYKGSLAVRLFTHDRS